MSWINLQIRHLILRLNTLMERAHSWLDINEKIFLATISNALLRSTTNQGRIETGEYLLVCIVKGIKNWKWEVKE